MYSYSGTLASFFMEKCYILNLFNHKIIKFNFVKHLSFVFRTKKLNHSSFNIRRPNIHFHSIYLEINSTCTARIVQPYLFASISSYFKYQTIIGELKPFGEP